VPRLVFINKMDVVGANFDNAVAEVRERLEGNPVPLNIPVGSGGERDSATPFRGIIDLIEMKALFFDPDALGKTFREEAIPDEMQLDVMKWREEMFNRLTAFDDKDQITSLVLDGKDVPTATLRALIREQTLKRQIQPVLCGSGREHIGIQPLLDAMTYYLPCPLDRPPVSGTNPKKKDKEEKRKPDPKEPFAALVFKVVADDKRELYYLRIYSGTLKPQSRPFNPGKDCKELLSKIYHTMADPTDLRELEEAHAGDIVAVIGLKESITGDTLCDPQHPILLERIKFAEAVISQSIEPESSADKQKLTDRLNLLMKEDPTFQWKVDANTGETLMSGMGTLHLEIKRHRLERDFKLKVKVRKPRVSYRESLRKPIRTVGECVRQAGTQGIFAKIHVSFETHNEKETIQVRTALPDDCPLPPLFVASAEQGIRGALASGEQGYPVMNVRATITGGEMDEASSNETAFMQAGADAVHKAMKDNYVILEPVMRLEVQVPEDYLGPVQSDLNVRRADISNVHVRGKLRVIEADVPLREMVDYADRVRSLSQGRASSSLEPRAYRPVPDEVFEQLTNPDRFEY
jgi:elongation factor G